MPHTSPPRPFRLLAVIVCAVVLGGAGAQSLTVSAASSLTETMQDLATAFEERHEGVRVRLNFASSATLATQIVQGAPVDVFASANVAQMDAVAEAGLLSSVPEIFAHNRLVVIAEPVSKVRSVRDLAEPGIRLVLAGPEVPAGAYARQVLHDMDARYGDGFAASVLDNLVSEEPNVRQVAAKVALGEAEAALVYATDAAVLDGVRTVPIDEAWNVVADYPVAVLAEADDADLARAFVAFVRGEDGRAILSAHGFTPAD